ncbi:MAG: hypothetical protein ACXWA3_02610, partial [Acidimicrobiales bacterium]
RAVLAYVLGAVQAEHLGSLSGAGTLAIAALPPDQHPNLVDAARHAGSISAEDEFLGGLEILLRGMGAAPSRRRSHPAPAPAPAPARSRRTHPDR